MAFVANNLQLDSNVGFINRYTYVTNDSLVTVGGSGYFNSVAAQLKKGDIIVVSAANNATPATQNFVVSSADGASPVTTVGAANITVTSAQTYTVEATVPAPIGTASTEYVVVDKACTVTRIDGVSNANGATATATITVAKVGGATIGTITFPSSYTAGSVRSNTSPTAVALSAGDVLSVATDGGGDGTGNCRTTLQITPS